MRGTGECCHYDEGYDDGYEDGYEDGKNDQNGPALSDAALYLRVLARQRVLAGDEQVAAALNLVADEMTHNGWAIEAVVKREREREQELLIEYKKAVAA